MEKVDQFQEQNLSEEYLFCRLLTEVYSELLRPSQTLFTFEMQDSMAHARVNASEGVSYYHICKHFTRDTLVTDYIKKRLSIQNEKELVPGQSPGRPHEPDVKEKILFHSQLLLLVSILQVGTE